MRERKDATVRDLTRVGLYMIKDPGKSNGKQGEIIEYSHESTQDRRIYLKQYKPKTHTREICLRDDQVRLITNPID